MSKPIRELKHDPELPVSLNAIGQLYDARHRTLNWLESIDSDHIDSHLDGYHNTIGTLLYHIAAIEASWLFTEILQENFPADIAALFSYPVRDEAGLLFRVAGVSVDEHLNRFAITRSYLLNALQGITFTELRKRKEFEDYLVTDEWIVHHLLQHESEHRGEMMAIYALLTR
jgi:uncharacterized damage-inducible protein DinB